MRRIICFFLLLTALQVHSQNPDSFQRSVDSLTRSLDSFHINMPQADKDFEESNARNLNALVQMNEDRVKKQKQQAYVRIGIGVAFLVVLVIGLMRRRKTKV